MELSLTKITDGYYIAIVNNGYVKDVASFRFIKKNTNVKIEQITSACYSDMYYSIYKVLIKNGESIDTAVEFLNENFVNLNEVRKGV
ncbi:MAG: hypothetical protein WC934_14940 [Acidithiobacillus sp.]|jgi:hypothetical protein|uniref:hypothetical protein n=1 Tax=Acidithiobacillus sp. TaxID=1872118 RepID=UPI00355DC624